MRQVASPLGHLGADLGADLGANLGESNGLPPCLPEE
jgi:hypothetical protein